MNDIEKMECAISRGDLTARDLLRAYEYVERAAKRRLEVHRELLARLQERS